MDKRYECTDSRGRNGRVYHRCALGGSDLKVGVVEYRLSAGCSIMTRPMTCASRPLSVASQNIIDMVGAWEGILSRRSCPYMRMKVWEADEARAATEFNADDIQQPYLGHIVENRVDPAGIAGAVSRHSAHRSDLPCYPRSKSITSPGCSLVRLDDGTELVGKLLVAADGGESRVRQAAGIGVHKWDYEQQALVASVKTSFRSRILLAAIYPHRAFGFLAALKVDNASLFGTTRRLK